MDTLAGSASRSASGESIRVFHYALGSEGHGYAICLACGRADPENAPKQEQPPLPRGMAVHRPLRSKRGSGWCDGAANGNSPFMIQRHRALGYEVTTDVFDLQLAGLQSFSVALPLAAALRNALARKLGVEVAEMGIAASQTLADDGVPQWSILIYDKAPGALDFRFQPAFTSKTLSGMPRTSSIVQMARIAQRAVRNASCAGTWKDMSRGSTDSRRSISFVT
jgi:DEAD/DEAH box helicase domain-containing protein